MKIIFSILLVFIGFCSLKAQDPLFSQYYVNGLYINPAMNSAKGNSKASMQYRSQWAGKEYRFSTYAASLEVAFEKSNSSIGFMAVSDETRNNYLHNSTFSFVYAYKIQLNNKWLLQTALQLGMGQNKLSNDLIFEDQLSLEGPAAVRSQEQFADESLIYPDFSSGVAILSQKFYMGLAVHHMNEANQAFRDSYTNKLKRKYTLHGGFKVSRKTPGRMKTYYSPNLIIQKQGTNVSYSLGNYFYNNGFTAGLWYRWKDAIVAGFGYELDKLKISYSVDFGVQQFISNSLSHEVSLIIKLQSKNNTPKQFNDGLVYYPSF